MAIRQVIKQASERRDNARQELNTVMPLTMVVLATGATLACRVFDVSAEGLCLIASAELAPGAQLEFVTLYERIPLVVAWCRPDAGRTFRCGVTLFPGGRDLRTLFSVRLAG